MHRMAYLNKRNVKFLVYSTLLSSPFLGKFLGISDITNLQINTEMNKEVKGCGCGPEVK